MLSISPKNNRALIAAISVFIVLDLSLLILNFWISKKLETGALEINMAGRQRMLSQQLTKSVLLFNQTETTENHARIQSAKIELLSTYQLFDDTLNAFLVGGKTLSTDGKIVYLNQIQSEQPKAILNQTLELWNPIDVELSDLTADSQTDFKHAIDNISEYIISFNTDILYLMNELTNSLEYGSKREASKLRMFQLIAVILALINFIIIIYQFTNHVKLFKRGQILLSQLIDKIDSAVLTTKADGSILNANRQCVNLFGYGDDEIDNHNLSTLVRSHEGESVGCRKDSSTFFAEITRNRYSIDNETLYIFTIRDISDQKIKEESLFNLAYYDTLTSLPTRPMILENLKQEVARSHRDNLIFSVCFVDLDGFKEINDKYGHDIGDLVLVEVGKVLSATARESDTTGRLGGDEFVSIYTNIKNSNNAEMLAQKILSGIAAITSINGHKIFLGASIGVAIYPDHGLTIKTLLKAADQAMYAAKRAGKNKIEFAGNKNFVESLSAG